MIVYENTKINFLKDIESGSIQTKVYDVFKKKIGNTTVSEQNSWGNSLKHMYIVMSDSDIPANSGIAIEYKIPLNSKRIDFIVSGENNNNKVAVIIELKQWDKIQAIKDKDGIVKTYLGGSIRETTHPSCQVASYAKYIKDFNELVDKGEVRLYPSAFLHNYEIKDNYDPILDEVYNHWIKQAPVFGQHDINKLRTFIKKHIKYGDNKETLYLIENGKIRPSKSLQDSMVKMIKGNAEFTMLDEQKVAYEKILHMAKESISTNKKKVLIVNGGPGTGKSVLAVQLLVELTRIGMLCQYVSKNSAPRNVYSAILKGTIKKSSIDNLFKGSGNYYSLGLNELDAVLVDEAHRLNKKSGIYSNIGENQIMELIRSSKLSVFFIDEKQRVTYKDSGTINQIKYFAAQFNADIDSVKLVSQFRCNGSTGYLSFIDDLLQLERTANHDGFDLDYDLQVFDDPNEMFDKIVEKNKYNNKSRVLAGYCWEWPKKGRNNTNYYDIIIDKYNFKKSWNLENTSTYMIDEDSVNQIGCIHTSQGLELDYVGVIIGDDLIYDGNNVITDFTKRAKTDQSIKGIKKLMKTDYDEATRIADEIVRNTYRVLLTRGIKGCYIYCVDELLNQYIKNRIINIGKFISSFE